MGHSLGKLVESIFGITYDEVGLIIGSIAFIFLIYYYFIKNRYPVVGFYWITRTRLEPREIK
jgi:type IV secretory pathway VirB3-like protein